MLCFMPLPVSQLTILADIRVFIPLKELQSLSQMKKAPIIQLIHPLVKLLNIEETAEKNGLKDDYSLFLVTE